MTQWSAWLHSPRGLLILLTTIVALPAATLVWLGLRLLQQDRELERQRRAEILQDASDRAVHALEREVSQLRVRLADPGWLSTTPAAGSIHVVLTKDGIRVEPASSMAYWPTAAALDEMPGEPFREADAAELERHDFAGALEIARRLAGSSADPVRAGALLRQGRLLRKLGRIEESLKTYSELGRIPSVAINGLPADLQARKTRCVLLAEQSRIEDLRREAASIDADLAAGRWRLDRENIEYLESLFEAWLGSPRSRRGDRTLFADSAGWLYHQWTAPANGALTATGTHALPGATAIWASTPNGVAAVVVTDSYVEREWLAKAQQAAAPATIALLATADARAVRSNADAAVLARSAAESGLPWTLTITLSNHANEAPFETRRRTLLAALAAVLVLVAAGSYVILRTRSREMTLARLQSDFVTAVSHEFRTPLTALLQFNDLLDESRDLSLEVRHGYYQAQRRATERLHRLVESLLDFGRMEAGKRPYTMERVDAGLLVRDVCDDFRGELEGRGLALRVAIDSQELSVEADAEALARAVWNLLDNAAKYSGDGREIDVLVTRADGVSIAVRDRGIGIPAHEQGRIFQKFTRGAAAASRRIRGTGIGLAMVQHIITAHRGTLKVESVEHRGSTFTIVLPQAPDSRQREADGSTNVDSITVSKTPALDAAAGRTRSLNPEA